MEGAPSHTSNAPPLVLHERAAQNIKFIRDAMERAGAFTAISGMGGMVVGALAVLAALYAQTIRSVERWIGLWLMVALLTLCIFAITTVRKARNSGASLNSALARKFGLGLVPGLIAGGVLTVALYRAGLSTHLPGVWALLYGVSVISAGMFSIRIVPLIGLSFMTVGVLCLLFPHVSRDLQMGASFGGLHLVGGFFIAKRYGG